MGAPAYNVSQVVTSKCAKSTTQQKCVPQNVVTLQSPAEKSPIRSHLDSNMSALVQEGAAHLETTATRYLKKEFRRIKRRPEVFPTAE